MPGWCRPLAQTTIGGGLMLAAMFAVPACARENPLFETHAEGGGGSEGVETGATGVHDGSLSTGDVSILLSQGRPPKRPGSEPITVYAGKRVIEPSTSGQLKYVETMLANDITFCTGPAGTGKTYLAVAVAVSMLREKQIRRIVLARPAVEAGEKLGFLPGDLQAKVNPYLRPLFDVATPDLPALLTRVADEVYEVVFRYDGTITAEHGMGRLRVPYLTREWGETIVGYMRRVKDSFDSDDLLNPEVMFSDRALTDDLKPI